MRYRLDFVGFSVEEVVRKAGGWLFDRVWAGWDVTVFISGDDDVRPLQILGADTADREAAMLMWEQRRHPRGLAVSTDLLAVDARVRGRVLSAVKRNSVEVTLWGDTWLDVFDGVIATGQHDLSAAAMAFKAQALAGVGVPDPVSPVEVFGYRLMSGRAVPANILSRSRHRHH